MPGHVGGESEALIGKWLKKTGKRNQVLIATKAGMDMGNGHKGLSAVYIEQALERSLKRLQTDYIDLYQSHCDDPHTSVEETMGAFGEAVERGKVRAIGASNFDAKRLREAREVCDRLKLPHYQSLQPNYNLYDRSDYETRLEPTVKELGLGVINFYSLAAGLLTGKYRSEADLGKSSVRGYKVKNYMTERGFAIIDALEEVAGGLSATPAQVALAWLMARPSITAPIVSASKLEQLPDLIAAVELKLNEEAMQRLNTASAY